MPMKVNELKCHEDLNTLDTYVQGKKMDNKCYIYVKTLTYLAKFTYLLTKWGPRGGGGGEGLQ